jgi:hypothetical protein
MKYLYRGGEVNPMQNFDIENKMFPRPEPIDEHYLSSGKGLASK